MPTTERKEIRPTDRRHRSMEEFLVRVDAVLAIAEKNIHGERQVAKARWQTWNGS